MDINELRALIPHGYGKEIAKRAGVSQRTVSHFLTGKRKNYRLEMVALELAIELKNNRDKLISKLAK